MSERLYSVLRMCCLTGAVLLWNACHETHEEVVLPPDEVLVELICDLHKAEAVMNRSTAESQDTLAAKIRDRIATSHNITAQQMDTWLDALQKSPEHLIAVYDSVIVRLEREVTQ